jgi:hypothetical protein
VRPSPDTLFAYPFGRSLPSNCQEDWNVIDNEPVIDIPETQEAEEEEAEGWTNKIPTSVDTVGDGGVLLLGITGCTTCRSSALKVVLVCQWNQSTELPLACTR